MKGIAQKDLIELLVQGHEAEFSYNNKHYIIQPEYEYSDGCDYMTVWSLDTSPHCIMKVKIPQTMTNDFITAYLSKPCFGTKSFLDVSDDINVTNIF